MKTNLFAVWTPLVERFINDICREPELLINSHRRLHAAIQCIKIAPSLLRFLKKKD